MDTTQTRTGLWEDSDPVLWRRAASDWRALWISDEVGRRGRQALTDDLGYAGPSKIDTLQAQGRRLRADAAAGDREAIDRLTRAEDLGRILTARQ
ncbi:hypothetical protein [Frankia sp. Cr1]|uniref:hypothetical protein n=1 Tax=Frankia sp. Cr1 TaxID=3073931 RepID=UPI002AD25E4E|nr:hypothetical protein [Frankia sp. Cr1]